MNMRIAGIVNDSIVDGPGLRLAIFAQGCPHHCPGCHNHESHDFAGGSDMDTEKIIARMDANPLLDGITLTGGGGMLRGLDERLRAEIGVPVHVSETALINVVEGCAMVLEVPDFLSQSYMQQR